MTMLGRGKRSASDKKSDKKNEKSDKAAKAEEAARAAELAEEAAAKAREAARLAQQAAEEAAAAEDDEADTDDPENAVKSPEKPAPSEKDSEDAPAPEGAREEASASEKADADAEGEPDEGDDTKPARTKLTKKLPKDEADDEAEDDAEKAEEAEEDGDDDDEPRRSRRGGLTTVIAVLAVLTVALGAGTTALYLKVSDQKATEEASKDASFASSRAAQKLSSYDFQTLDTDLKSASALTTGKLHTDYEKLAQELKTVAVQQQAVSNTTVMKVGVVSATPDKVVTLVYANRSSRTKADKQQRLPEPLRIKMTMVKKDGKWLASDLKVIS